MAWTEAQIKSIFSRKDLSRGMEYYQRGQVSALQVTGEPGHEKVTCTVTGSDVYDVSFQFNDDHVNVYCSCPRFAEKRICKHLAAGMLAFSDTSQQTFPLQSDAYAQWLLRSYMEKAKSGDASDAKAHLVPRIFPGYMGEHPSFSFTVGFERLYVVRDIRKFLDSVSHRETVQYGKGLTLYHGLEQFDTLSQGLIGVLMDQFTTYRSMRTRLGYYDYDNYLWGQGSDKGQITLNGSAFDRWFDLLEGHTVESGRAGNEVTFLRETPSVFVSLKKLARAAQVEVLTDGDYNFFGSSNSLYALGDGKLLRCDDAFRERLYPLLQKRNDKMQMAFSDLPVFCGVVLPKIEDIADIQDPDGLLREYLPDECTACFYFDLDDDILSLRLAYRYGDKQFDFGSKAPKDVKRDVMAEEEAQRLAMRYFESAGSARFTLSGDDAVFTFLTESLEQFRQRGEVFVSDRLRAKQIQPSSAAVGVSVSNGMLQLDLNTGGFPVEELEALYQSLLKKRRYHRLKDGRYLSLDGSGCETLAEMSHMLQLSPKDLTKGTVTLPAFRALYVDNLLSDGNSGLQVARDRQFKAMIRNFKSLSEGDYTLPKGLENTLRPYQKTGFQWLKTLESCNFGGILADEMGLGKTAQVIAYLSTVDRKVSGLSSLVVCPASLVLNWQDEFTKFAPELSVTLILGTAAERRKRIAESGEADVCVTSYELLRQDIEQYQERKFYCCVLDEAQYIKNQSTLVSKAVKQVDCKQRFVLTGTPIENRLSELWNLFDFLMPGYLFSHRSFVEKLEKPVVKSEDKEAAEQLRRLVRPFMLRRLKKDVLKELPPKIEHVRRIPLSEEERKVYHATALATREGLESSGGGKLEILAALTRLRQICCAPELCFENYQGPDSKLDAALELCASMVENGHQILLFSQFTSMLERIRTRLDEMKISSFTLQGSTSKENRAKLVKAFNAGEASVFLISLKAGGTGLNLTAADVVIHYDPWWNLAAQDQATDRAHRIGQNSHVQVYKLIAKDTIEERILELQSKKAALMDAVSEGSDVGITDMSKEDLLALLD